MAGTMARTLVWGAVLLALAAAGPATAAAEARKLVFETTIVEIDNGRRVHRMRVQFAASPAQLSRGLMYRRTLEPWDGMLFDFRVPQTAHIWMKNTYIPLDVIFIRADGTIESIARGVPETETVMSSRGPVRGVLELRQGAAKRLGIRPGDAVRHRIFGRSVGQRR